MEVETGRNVDAHQARINRAQWVLVAISMMPGVEELWSAPWEM
jgi:hypothetical protein